MIKIGDMKVTGDDGRAYSGPSIRSITSMYRYQFRRYHNTRETSNIIRFAMVQAGRLWITVFLPKRFDMSYAKSYLQYRVKKSYETRKIGDAGSEDYAGRMVAAPQPVPFVYTGSSRQGILSSARPQASVTAGKAVLKVRFHLGNIAFHMSDSFCTVPPQEYRRVVEEVERVLRRDVLPSVMLGTTSLYLRTFKNPRPGVALPERTILPQEREVYRG